MTAFQLSCRGCAELECCALKIFLPKSRLTAYGVVFSLDRPPPLTRVFLKQLLQAGKHAKE